MTLKSNTILIREGMKPLKIHRKRLRKFKDTSLQSEVREVEQIQTIQIKKGKRHVYKIWSFLNSLYLVILTLLAEQTLPTPVGLTTVPCQLLDLSTTTSPLNQNSFTTTPGDYQTTIHPVPQSFTIHAINGFGSALGNTIALFTCAEGAVNPTVTLTTDGTGLIEFREAGALKFTFNGGANYHVSVTKSGLDFIVFAQRYDTFDSKWDIITTDCVGVESIAFNDNAGQAKRFMTGWIDGIDPRRAEILHVATSRDDGVWSVFFDHGWYSYLPPKNTRTMSFTPNNFLGGNGNLEIDTSLARFARNGTQLALGEQVVFAFDEAAPVGVFLNRFVIYAKVRMTRGLLSWLMLDDFDAGIPEFNTRMNLSFDNLGRIILGYYDGAAMQRMTFPAEYEEDKLLEIALGFNGIETEGYTRVTLNVNTTYVEDYNYGAPGGPVTAPNNLNHFASNIVRFRSPRLVLKNNNFADKYLRVYELQIRESGMIGRNCGFKDGCSAAWLGRGINDPLVIGNKSPCHKCNPSKYKNIAGGCTDCTTAGFWQNPDLNICMKCSDNCNCDDTDACHSCSVAGYMKDETCQRCSNECATCEGSPTTCTSCSGLGKKLQDGKCVDDCDITSHYQVDGTITRCERCHYTCTGCFAPIPANSQPLNTQCKKCNSTVAFDTFDPNLVCKPIVDQDYLENYAVSAYSKKRVQVITTYFTQYVYPHLPPLKLPSLPEQQRLELSPQMYFSGYISLLPPPTFILPKGTNILFKLTSEFDFIDLEVRLKIIPFQPATSKCIFEATIAKTHDIQFGEKPCKDIKGGRNWFFLGVGLDFEDGVARGGIIGEIGGNVFKDQFLVESGINIMRQPIGSKEWHEIENEISFGGTVKGSSAPSNLDNGVAFKIKKWEMTDWWGKGDDWEYGRAVWGEDSVYWKLEPVEDQNIYRKDYVDGGGANIDRAHSYFKDASGHRHTIALINAAQPANLYTSYWLHGAFVFKNPDDYPIQHSFISTLWSQYSTPYVISFWYKTPLVDPLANEDFRILSYYIHDDDAQLDDYDDATITPNDMGPSLAFNLGFTAGAYNGNFIYKKPDDTDIVQTTPLVKDKWYHFTVEYYRMMGSKNIQIRFMKNGVNIDVPSTITGGFQQDKSFYVRRRFIMLAGEHRNLADPPAPGQPLTKAYGMMRNVTLFTHTSAIHNCPIGCKLCTKDLRCFFMDPLIPTKLLMGHQVVDDCPDGYAKHNQVCQPTYRKKLYVADNIVSVRCLNGAEDNDVTEWEPDLTPGQSFLSFTQRTFPLGPKPRTEKIEVKYQTFNDIPKNYRIIVLYDPPTGAGDENDHGDFITSVHTDGGTLITPTCTNTPTFEYTCIFSVRTIDDPINDEIRDRNPNRFYVYFFVEEGDYTCSNGATPDVDPLNLHNCDYALEEVRNYNECHESCQVCYGISKSKLNCRFCKEKLTLNHYFNTQNEAEIICQERYQAEQILPPNPTNPNPDIDNNFRLSYIDCDYHEIYKIPSYLMPTYVINIPNWKCQNLINTLNILGVTKVNSLQYEDAEIGSWTYGTYQCLVDCELYPYLQIYSNLCKDYDAVGVNVAANTFQCCRYGVSGANCKVSCFEDVTGYPTSANTCGTCNPPDIPRVQTTDVFGNPTVWTCDSSGYTCRLEHKSPDPLVPSNPPVVNYCYDCQTDDFYPKIVSGTPFGFQCIQCNNKHYFDGVDPGVTSEVTYTSLPVTCVDTCNLAPKFLHNPTISECLECTGGTPFYDSDPVAPAGCKGSCINYGGQTGRGFNPLISYCGKCYDPLVSNTDDCKNFCPKPKLVLTISGTIQCVDSCPSEMYSNFRTAMDPLPNSCDLCDLNTHFILNGNCVPGVCPDGTYKDKVDFQCKPCHSNCKTCILNGEVGCTSCFEGYALEELNFPLDNGLRCVKCDYVCIDCHSSYRKSCTQCRDPYYPYEISSATFLGSIVGLNPPQPGAPAHPTDFKFCVLNRCEAGFVLESADLNPITNVAGPSCQPCNSVFERCSLCTFESCTLCETGFYPDPIADPNDPTKTITLICRPCGYNIGPLTQHPLLTLDPDTNRCKGRCDDGRRMRPEVFNLFGVDLEECDDGNQDDKDGCDSNCKVEPGWKCTGGTWNTPDVCERIQGVEVEIAAVLTKFDDNEALFKNYNHYGINQGEDIIVVLKFNEKLILQESQLLEIIGIEIDDMTAGTDFTYTIEWDATGKKSMVVRIMPRLSLTKHPFTIKFQNTEIISEDGRFLLTTQLDSTVHRFLVKSTMDSIFSGFFKYATILFYGLAALLIGIFSISNLNAYFGSLFEAFVILLVKVKLDPVTIEESKDILGPLITYDFFGVLKSQDPIVEDARLLQKSEHVLDFRYRNVGIHDVLMVNLIFHVSIFFVSLVMMLILKLIISAHSTKGGESDIVKKAFEDAKLKENNGMDSAVVKVDKTEDEESELIDKLKSLYAYMNMSGFINMMRFIFPQVFFLAFLFIRYYTKEQGLIPIMIPLAILLCCLILLSQLYLIGSFKLVGNRQYGEQAKFDDLALKKQREEDRVRMMEAVHNKEEQKKQKKKNKKMSKVAQLRQGMSAKKKVIMAMTKAGFLKDNGDDDLDDSQFENLTQIEKKEKIRERQVKEELKLEKDYNLAHDDMDEERELAIKLRKMRDQNVNYSVEIRNYNPQFNSMFKGMKLNFLNVRLYPFLDLMTTGLFVMVIVVIDSSPIMQALILMVLQALICLYTSLKKPYIKNIDNMRIIVDKIINLIITIIFFVFATNETKPFIGNYTRVRFLERGFLMFLLLIKMCFVFTLFAMKIYNEMKAVHMERQRKKAEAKKLKEEEELKNATNPLAKHMLYQNSQRIKIGKKGSMKKMMSQTEGQLKSNLANPTNININKKMSAKQKRKAERKLMNQQLKQKRAEKMYDKRGRLKMADERKDDVEILDLNFKAQILKH